MRDHLKRLERLERETVRREPIRVIRQIIRAINGKAAPYDPTTARCGEESISRAAGESLEAFEARALAHFAGNRLIIERR